MSVFASKSFSAGTRPASVTNPDKLPQLEIWYNADLGTSASGNFNTNLSNGDDVGQWKGRSTSSIQKGSNLNNSGNASVKPNWYANQAGAGTTFGIIRFNGSSESLNMPSTVMENLSGFTIFIVAKPVTVGVTTRTICSTDVGDLRISNSTNWSVSMQGCTGVSTVTGVGDTSKFNIFGLIFDGTGIGNTNRLKFRYNKTPRALTYTGTVAGITTTESTTFNVGVGSAGNSQYFSGDIAEILMFKRTLNSSEIGGVESYLTSHWNI